MGKTILTPIQRDLLIFLSKDHNFVANFCFTGGTALSEFYLKHRFSDDLDFFSKEEIDDLWLTTLTKDVKIHLKTEKVDIQKSFNRNLVFFSIGDEVIKTEFTYFPFEYIQEPKKTGGIKIESLIDLAVNKFFTIYQKPSARHFINLYLMIKRKKIKWEELSKLARIKFDTVIDPLQLGTSLVRSKDITGLPKMIINLDESEWRDFFYKKALELKSEIGE